MTALHCLACDDERAAGATFCEACGRRLVTCAHCGGGVGDDGYCESCGMLAERPGDHLVVDAGPVAGVTDRGKRHHRNEDALFVAARGDDVDLVVCDGVSASARPDEASSAAAAAAASSFEKGADAQAAVLAAAAAVAGLGREHEAPACTIVAATLRGDLVSYAWVGDSRAYWVPADGPAVQLTEDDSWARHAVELGADPAQAMLMPQAHAITAWLGADAGEVRPHYGEHRVTEPGHLVLCTDGLWNYLTDPAAFAAAVRDSLGDGPLAAAQSLVGLANERGGGDNITVALTPAGGPRGVHR